LKDEIWLRSVPILATYTGDCSTGVFTV